MTNKKIKTATKTKAKNDAITLQCKQERSPITATRNVGGRPKGPTDPTRKLQLDREAAVRSQRSDCKALHGAIKKALALKDRGCGTAGIAAAIKSLATSMETCHKLQVAAYGMKGDSRGVQAVIVLPAVAVDMDTWQALTGGKLGSRAPADDRRKLRQVEQDVYGTEGGDE